MSNCCYKLNCNCNGADGQSDLDESAARIAVTNPPSRAVVIHISIVSWMDTWGITHILGRYSTSKYKSRFISYHSTPWSLILFHGIALIWVGSGIKVCRRLTRINQWCCFIWVNGGWWSSTSSTTLKACSLYSPASVSRAFDAEALDELAVSMYLSWGCSRCRSIRRLGWVHQRRTRCPVHHDRVLWCERCIIDR